jgi:hypothetical protein
MNLIEDEDEKEGEDDVSWKGAHAEKIRFRRDEAFGAMLRSAATGCGLRFTAKKFRLPDAKLHSKASCANSQSKLIS